MRKRVAISVVLAALAFAPIASGQARQREADVRALEQLQKRVDAAIIGGDVETYVTLITADAVLMPPNSPPIKHLERQRPPVAAGPRPCRSTGGGEMRWPPLDGTCELRVFTIHPGKMEDFRHAWLAGVHPLRLKHGFTIPAAWSVADTNQFMWLLCYRGPESFESKDDAYYASTGRQALKPDPREFIARAEKWFIAPTIPSP